MYYFKYFRNDANFDKSIRYNELFFAANSSLNDPMDLWFNPIFWDGIDLWKQFIGSYDNGFVLLMDYISKPQGDDFYISINNLFKGKSLAKIVEDKTIYKRNIIDIIKNNELAKGTDVTSAASLLMDKFIHIKNNTNFISVSFSRDPFNYLMWSHYANGFKGCILIYDFEDNTTKLKTHILGKSEYDVKMMDVRYSNSPEQIDLWKVISENTIDNGNYFFTKNNHWEYEKESRLVLYSPHQSNGEIFHHDPSLVKGVIFGSRCDTYFKERTIRALKENRNISGIEDFLSFDTILNDKNEIELKSGIKQTIKNVFNLPLGKDVIDEWNNSLKFKEAKTIK
ncbi:DUF2971 domain-containing protein [Cedecea sp. FDAARGOS_727]|uniref:DUF2971 domain-containing protein n=1 Tax=Cedecea sp. FDAARGOS_727 TaxID=2545798 RepID=UPI00143EC6CD|nr:DUF2971 domain-containing protein [Cedecea sp. FDAARGOS_727]QIX98296.1 DUF2971 domain-containing protein [Cedecea sp. FDAARGOS_727]